MSDGADFFTQGGHAIASGATLTVFLGEESANDSNYQDVWIVNIQVRTWIGGSRRLGPGGFSGCS